MTGKPGVLMGTSYSVAVLDPNVAHPNWQALVPEQLVRDPEPDVEHLVQYLEKVVAAFNAYRDAHPPF